jgi:hypothetical protein
MGRTAASAVQNGVAIDASQVYAEPNSDLCLRFSGAMIKQLHMRTIEEQKGGIGSFRGVVPDQGEGWFFVTYDLQVMQESVLQANRSKVVLSATCAHVLRKTVISLKRRLAQLIREEYPGTLLAQQMAELKEHFQKQDAKEPAL